MPQTVTITSEAYRFDELSDEAKEKARSWYREGLDQESFHFDCEIEEFTRVCEIIGIDFDTHEVKLMNGKTRREPNIWWSVSHCQGDGACFEGTYDYRATAERELREINDNDDWVPLKVARELAEIQLRNAFGLQATMQQTDSHYTHEHTISIDVHDRRNEDRTVDQAPIAELMRDLMRYLHRQLHEQQDYIYSDEAVDDSITANEYMFTEEGRRHAYA